MPSPVIALRLSPALHAAALDRASKVPLSQWVRGLIERETGQSHEDLPRGLAGLSAKRRLAVGRKISATKRISKKKGKVVLTP